MSRDRTPGRERVLHWLHDRLCPCRSTINSHWECGYCGMINHPRWSWCQDPDCRALRERN